MTPAGTDQDQLGSVATFYDRLAPDYDIMTEFEKRFVKEKPFFRLLVEKYHIKSALDAGAGTGFHSLLLARLGVNVTAVDISAEMLRRLQQHAAEHEVPIHTVQAPFERLCDHLTDPFDGIFCLGNSLAHLLTAEDLRRSLVEFRNLLAPRGILLLQVLNYDRILAERETVQSVREVAGKVYARSYVYHENLIDFHITSSEKGAENPSIRHTVALRPVQADELIPLLQGIGFTSVLPYGGISLEKFDKATSRDLVILAREVA